MPAAAAAADLRPPPLPEPSPEISPPPPPPPPSRRLHSFSFPSLSWGKHQLLRCTKTLAGTLAAADSGASPRPLSTYRRRSPPLRPPSPSPSPSPDKTPSPGLGPPRVRVSKGKADPEHEAEEFSSAAARPWNLRARRAACNAPAEGGRGTRVGPPMASGGSNSPLRASERANSAAKMVEGLGREGGAARFSISLTKREIEEDFLAFKGTKPPRRPKKRPRITQRQLDALFPGLWLSEITPDSYKTDE